MIATRSGVTPGEREEAHCRTWHAPGYSLPERLLSDFSRQTVQKYGMMVDDRRASSG
jgi:hypothetical protein